jgi:predicted GNAT family acetyltransferase
MLALATLTRPGPFAPRTPELGEFWGIKDGDTLVAMAGERMRQPGFTELSGVCTHPDARGQGLARLLSSWVVHRIASRGETPYLHAYASNTQAIDLYRSLGFIVARTMHVAQLARG